MMREERIRWREERKRKERRKKKGKEKKKINEKKEKKGRKERNEKKTKERRKICVEKKGERKENGFDSWCSDGWKSIGRELSWSTRQELRAGAKNKKGRVFSSIGSSYSKGCK